MSVFFEPFVGKDYYSGGVFGKRILALGESQYCGEGCADCGNSARHRDCMSFTKGVLNDYLNADLGHQGWMNTFRKFERSLVGHETDAEESRRIWQSLLFYDYLQVAMNGPREAGTAEQYSRSVQAFYEVLDKYLPQYIIVWGSRLWNFLPGDSRWRGGEPIVIDGYKVQTGSYALRSGGRAKAMTVNHPSVGYSWDWWHKAINEFLK